MNFNVSLNFESDSQNCGNLARQIYLLLFATGLKPGLVCVQPIYGERKPGQGLPTACVWKLDDEEAKALSANVW